MSAPEGCSCEVCGDALKRTLPSHRMLVARHALMHGISPTKRRRVAAPVDADPSADFDVRDSSDATDCEEHEPAKRRSGAERLQQFSKEILEFIGANDVNQTHVIKILRTVRAHLGRCSETGIVCPVTLYTLKKHAGYTPSTGTSLLRLCAKDHPNLPDAANCAKCDMQLVTRWPRRMGC